jgi:DNA (cytosine-5)-methyltransferase 1
MTFGSLFAGVGGIDLGLERAGMECRWQVEIDPYCTKVLERHWPNVRRYGDIKTVTQPEYVDVLAGGFPCTDISIAGDQAGLDGARSGLYSEIIRLMGVVRPRYVLMENVAALLGLGMGRILADVAALGYDAEWAVLPASGFGSPHRRERVFILAYTMRDGMEDGHVFREVPDKAWREARLGEFGGMDGAESCSQAIANLCRDDDGIPSWVVRASALKHRRFRLKAIGNAVVPQVAEWIGRRIIEADARMK